MSNVIDNNEAPLPHLGSQEPGRQSWSPPIPTGDLFPIRFAWTARDYLRCQFRLMLLRVPATALGALVYGAAMTTLRFLRAHTVSPTLIYVFVTMTVAFFVGTLFFSALILLFVSLFATRMPRVFAVSPEGLRKTHTRLPTVIPWTHIARIVERNGDIYLMNTLGRGSGLAIPRTAFRDSDSSKRFHIALLALWKSGGNANAVPDDIRTEFVP